MFLTRNRWKGKFILESLRSHHSYFFLLRLNLTSMSWESLPTMSVARFKFEVVAVNVKIYVLGGIYRSGQNHSAVECYDPKTNSWESCPPMLSPRSCFGIGTMNGKIYTFGGEVDSDTETTRVDVFDTLTKTWTQVSTWRLMFDSETDINAIYRLVSCLLKRHAFMLALSEIPFISPAGSTCNVIMWPRTKLSLRLCCPNSRHPFS